MGAKRKVTFWKNKAKIITKPDANAVYSAGAGYFLSME